MTGKPHAASSDGEERASFGFREVPAGDKQRLVDDVFHKVAARYDLMNDLMSGGLHRVWKGAMVDWLAPPARTHSSYTVLDVAGGTGDIAFRIAERSPDAKITVADINVDMLAVGRERATARRLGNRVDFVEANAEKLPFPSDRYDAFTIAFGIRNVPKIDLALAEAYRVLKPGGRFLCLEFSTVDVPGLDRLYDLYSFNAIPQMGKAIVGEAEPYAYLVESIRRFPNPARFARMIEEAGFSRVEIRQMTGGVAAMHSAWKV